MQNHYKKYIQKFILSRRWCPVSKEDIFDICIAKSPITDYSNNLGYKIYNVIINSKTGNSIIFPIIISDKLSEEDFINGSDIYKQNNIYLIEAEYLRIYLRYLIESADDNTKEMLWLKENLDKITFSRFSSDSSNLLIFLGLKSYNQKFIIKFYRNIGNFNREPEIIKNLSMFNAPVAKYIASGNISAGGLTKPYFLITRFFDSMNNISELFSKLIIKYCEEEDKNRKKIVLKLKKLSNILGQKTAHLHNISNKCFGKKETTQSDIANWIKSIKKNIEIIDNYKKTIPIEFNTKKIISSIPSADRLIGCSKIILHDDLHLGQILIDSRNCDIRFVDFEGEPLKYGELKKEYKPPFKDIAGIIRSFYYIREEIVKKLKKTQQIGENIDYIIEYIISEFIISYMRKIDVFSYEYRKKLENKSFLIDILKFWVFEKNIYEIVYELKHRHEYIYIPLSGLNALLQNRLFPPDFLQNYAISQYCQSQDNSQDN